MKEKTNRTQYILKLSSLIINSLFLIIHIYYIIVFLISDTKLLVYVNIASVICYVLLFILIKLKKYEFFALICCIEIVAYMTSATIIVGSNAGFQLCFIGLCTLAFVTKYFLRDKKIIINPIIMSCIFMAVYLFLYYYSKYNNPIIILPDIIYSLLYISHSIVVFIFIVGFLILMIEYVFKLEKKIRKESETDKLTQIANRNALNEYYEKLGTQKRNYVVAIFDIDNFKQFNDINGHLCGDYVLKEIANIAKNNSLDDFVSRFGGEEFVIISKIDVSLENTYKKIDSIRDKIDKYEFEYNNKKLHSTITIGIAEYFDEDTLDNWILRADKKLYEGKNNGKNITVY